MDIESLSYSLARQVAQTWRRAVSGTMLPGMTWQLKSDRYRRAISDPIRTQDGWVVRVDPQVCDFAEDIEAGQRAIDLKPGLLSGPNAKIGPNGTRYVDVAFTFGRGVGPKAQAMPSGMSMAVSKDLIPASRLLKKLAGTPEKLANDDWRRIARWYRAGSVDYGRRNRLPLRATTRVTRGPNEGKPTRRKMKGYEQQFSHIADAHRVRDRRGRVIGLTTFRRISENSAPGSWVRPEIPANPVREAVLNTLNMGYGELAT